MYKNVELFNVASMESHSMGVLLSRYPKDVYKELSPLGSYVAAHSCSCEIRFVKEHPEDYVNVTLMCVDVPGNVVVLQGDQWETKVEFQPGEIKTIVIRKSTLYREKNESFFANAIYDPNVVRLVLSEALFVLCDINSFGKKLRPPKKAELPKYMALAYGSSITQGSGSMVAPLNYLTQTARQLNTQILNKGLAGSCYMEPQIAEWFSTISYDYMILEVGTNMFGSFSPIEIEERGKQFVEKIISSHPKQYLFIVEALMLYERKRNSSEYRAFKEAIRKVYETVGDAKCVYIPNEKIQLHSSYISTDLIHPSPYGHMMMGNNLAELLKPYIDELE